MGNLLNPWAVFLGLAGLTLPFVIHWLTKPRPLLMPLSTVRFVAEALRQNAWWYRLRDWIILLLRAAAVALIAAAMARPLFTSRPQVLPDDTSDAVRIVVLDVSESMAALENGIQVFERARAEAARYLQRGGGSRANLILAGATPRLAFPQASRNMIALRKQLSEASPFHEQLNLVPTLAAAADMLTSGGEDARPELIVVSDFQRGNWTAADFSLLPENTKIELVSVASDITPANAAVVALRCTDQRPAAGHAVKTVAEIANYTPQPRRLTLQITAGQQIETADVQCAPNSKTPITVPIQMPGNGWQPLTARLVDHVDSLPTDDQRTLVLNVRRTPRLVMLTREAPDRTSTASYFIDRALTSQDRQERSPSAEVTWRDPGTIKPRELSNEEGTVLVRPGRLSAELIGQLLRGMRMGKAVLYVASDAVDAHNLQQLTAQAGEDLQPPATLVPSPRAAQRQDLFLINLREEELPFAAFGDKLAPLISPLRFSGGLASQRNDRALQEDLLASYNDNTACLYLTPCGRGSLAVWNVDLVDSNLPGSPAFLPWVAELVRRQLANSSQTGVALSGERLVERLPPTIRDPSNLQLAGPKAVEGPFGELRTTEDGVLWEWERTAAPGVYLVFDNQEERRAVYATSVTLPTVESDLTSLDARVLTGRLAGGRAVHYQSARSGDSQDDVAWSWLAAGCVGCLLLELISLGVFRV